MRGEGIKVCFLVKNVAKIIKKWVNEGHRAIQSVITGNLWFIKLLTKFWSESISAKGCTAWFEF